MCGAWLSLRLPTRDSWWRTFSLCPSLHGGNAAVGGEVGLAREAIDITQDPHNLRGEDRGPMPRTSIRIAPKASAAFQIRASRSEISRFRTRTLRKSCEANCRQRCAVAEHKLRLGRTLVITAT